MTKKNDALLTKNDIYDVLTEFWEKVIYPELQQKPDKEEVDQKFDQVNNEIKHNRRMIRDLQADTPTKSEQNRLEKRVSNLEERFLN